MSQPDRPRAGVRPEDRKDLLKRLAETPVTPFADRVDEELRLRYAMAAAADDEERIDDLPWKQKEKALAPDSNTDTPKDENKEELEKFNVDTAALDAAKLARDAAEDWTPPGEKKDSSASDADGTGGVIM
jgi:hypothetical protein